MSMELQFFIGLVCLTLGIAGVRSRRGYMAVVAYCVVVIALLSILAWFVYSGVTA